MNRNRLRAGQFITLLFLTTFLPFSATSSILCPQPPIVPNSRIFYPDRQVGAVASYSCYSGYLAVGLDDPVVTNVTCLSTGEWSNADFACVSIKQLMDGGAWSHLPGPPDPDIPDDVSGIPIALMFADEGMPQQMPVMMNSFCDYLPRIEHGSIIEEGSARFSTAVGTNLSFVCNNGYYLDGPATIECLQSLEWTAHPVCRPYCKSPPIVPDSIQRVGFWPNDPESGRFFRANMTVEYMCNSGYVLVTRRGAHIAYQGDEGISDRVVKCLGNGQWSDPPMCLRVEMEQMSELHLRASNRLSEHGGLLADYLESCGPPPPTRHGNVSLDQSSEVFAVGETARYTCFEGYRLVGPAVIECMKNLKWSMNPTCVSKNMKDACPPPPEVPDSIHAKANPDTSWIVGETVLYLCQRGYHRTGDPVIQCLPKGYWTTAPKCVQQDPEPPSPEKTIVAKSKDSVKAPLHDSEFSSDAFKDRECDPPPNVDNGYIVQVNPPESRYQHGSEVTYRCSPNFTLFGSASIRCTDISLWESPPQCRPSFDNATPEPKAALQSFNGECPPDPVLPPNTFITERYMPTGRATVGSFIVLECLPDHYMVDGAGSPIIWCDTDFNWQQQEPHIQCRHKSLKPSDPITAAPPFNPNPPVNPYPPFDPNPPIVTNPPFNPGRTTSGMFDFRTDSNGDPIWMNLPTTQAPPATGTTVPAPCDPPPEISNGFMVKITRPNHDAARQMSQQNILYYYGVTVTYVCMSGYNFIGASTIMCQASGEWSGIPVCMQSSNSAVWPEEPWNNTTIPFRTTEMIPTTTVKLTCDMPPTINNGIVIGIPPSMGPIYPGTSVEYSCMGGFTVFGNAVVHCLRNGMWEMPPVCIPPTSAATSTSTTSTTTSAATTSKTTPETSTTQQCKMPPVIPNGELIYILPLEYAAAKTYYIGTAATYGCATGYQMIGMPTAYCGNDLTWHGVPVCSPEPTTTLTARCPAPPKIPNGYIVQNSAPADGAFNPGSSVQYQCSRGYRMIGFPRIFCTFELKWEGAPICESALIPLTTPSTASPTTSTTASTTTTTTTTTTTSTTTPIPPTTTTTTTPTTTTPTTTTTSTTTTTTTTPTTTTPTTTTLANSCPAPPKVANAKIIAAPNPPYLMGAIARYECISGFALMGPDSVVCLPFSTWSKSPECIPFTTAVTTPLSVQRDCPAPPVIPNGSSSVEGMTAKNYSPGSAVVYSCQLGYALVGTPIVLCAVSGEWSTAPRCVSQGSPQSARSRLLPERDKPMKVKCAEPSIIVHGYRASQSLADTAVGWQTGDSFEIECFSPYVRIGKGKAVCTDRGTWSEDPSCSKPPKPNEYNMNNRPMAKSAGSSNFMNRQPHRKMTHHYRSKPIEVGIANEGCGQPPAIEHAVAVLRSGTGQTPGTTYLYICEPPFKIQGSPTVLCSSNGKWSDAPKCHDPSALFQRKTDNEIIEAHTKSEMYCGPPPDVENGKVMSVPAVSSVDSVVSYQCLAHYQLRGYYQVRCLPSGRWSQAPACVPYYPRGDRGGFRQNVGSSNLIPVPVKAMKKSPVQQRPTLFTSRFDTASSLLFSAFSSRCYGGPDWPAQLQPSQLATKLATRELHIFREIAFNCTGLIVEWRYISVLPLKNEPVVVHFGIWRKVGTIGLKYRLVGSTKVTIVGSVRPEETISLKLHEAEFLHVEPGDVFGIHYDDGASSQRPGAIPLAYTFSPGPYTQPQLSSTLASLDDHMGLLKKQHQKQLDLQQNARKPLVNGEPEIEIDFDNYGFRFFRLPFVRALVHMI